MAQQIDTRMQLRHPPFMLSLEDRKAVHPRRIHAPHRLHALQRSEPIQRQKGLIRPDSQNPSAAQLAKVQRIIRPD